MKKFKILKIYFNLTCFNYFKIIKKKLNYKQKLYNLFFFFFLSQRSYLSNDISTNSNNSYM